jgi:hypothetical protein
VTTVFLPHVIEPGSGSLQGFFPLDFPEASIRLPDKGLGETIGMMNKIESILSLYAESALVGGAVHGRLYTDYAFILGQDIDRTPDSTIGADRTRLVDITG